MAKALDAAGREVQVGDLGVFGKESAVYRVEELGLFPLAPGDQAPVPSVRVTQVLRLDGKPLAKRKLPQLRADGFTLIDPDAVASSLLSLKHTAPCVQFASGVCRVCNRPIAPRTAHRLMPDVHKKCSPRPI